MSTQILIINNLFIFIFLNVRLLYGRQIVRGSIFSHKVTGLSVYASVIFMIFQNRPESRSNWLRTGLMLLSIPATIPRWSQTSENEIQESVKKNEIEPRSMHPEN